MSFTDALPQTTQLEIDGTVYTFSELHINAQSAIEEQYGIHFMVESMDEAEELKEFITATLRRPATVRFVAWQLLRQYHRDLTEDAVGYLVKPTNFVRILEIVMTSIALALPVDEEKKKEGVLELRASLAEAFRGSSEKN